MTVPVVTPVPSSAPAEAPVAPAAAPVLQAPIQAPLAPPSAAAPAAPEAAKEAPPSAVPAPAQVPVSDERTSYHASGGRKTIFSFVFLILLPFFVSVPMMIFNRIQHGLMMDNWGFLVLAAAFTALIFLVLVELIFSLRARVDLMPEHVRMTLPAGRGPTPMLRYKSHEIAYDQIHAVETRREIYGGALIPVLLKGARVITKDGTTIPLGYVSEANVDPAFPYPAIAKQIAERARLPLIDRGSVRRSVRSKMFGVKAVDDANEKIVDDTQIDALNRSHRNFVLALISGLVILMATGIVDDLSEERLNDQSAFVQASTSDDSSNQSSDKPKKSSKKNQ